MDIKDLNFQELLSEPYLVTVVGGMPAEGYGSVIDDTTIATTTVIATQTVGIQQTLLELDTLDTLGGHKPPSMCVPSDLPPYYICL